MLWTDYVPTGSDGDVVAADGWRGREEVEGGVSLSRFGGMTPEFMIAMKDKLGGLDSYNHYSVGWAWAMCTPYQWTKQVASHWGGTRNGTMVAQRGAAGVGRRHLGALRRIHRLEPSRGPGSRAARPTAALQRLWLIEAMKYNVLPIDDRRFERLNATISGRPQLVSGNTHDGAQVMQAQIDYSRLYAGRHYASDIVRGASLGQLAGDCAASVLSASRPAA